MSIFTIVFFVRQFVNVRNSTCAFTLNEGAPMTFPLNNCGQNVGAVQALTLLLKHVLKTAEAGSTIEIITDNKYVVKVIQEWLPKWVETNFVRSNGQFVQRSEVYRELVTVLEAMKAMNITLHLSSDKMNVSVRQLWEAYRAQETTPFDDDTAVYVKAETTGSSVPNEVAPLVEPVVEEGAETDQAPVVVAEQARTTGKNIVVTSLGKATPEQIRFGFKMVDRAMSENINLLIEDSPVGLSRAMRQYARKKKASCCIQSHRPGQRTASEIDMVIVCWDGTHEQKLVVKHMCEAAHKHGITIRPHVFPNV